MLRRLIHFIYLKRLIVCLSIYYIAEIVICVIGNTFHYYILSNSSVVIARDLSIYFIAETCAREHGMYQTKLSMVSSAGILKDKPSKDVFQLVTDDIEMLVYAAYYDERIHKVRVIAVSRVKHATVYCFLRYKHATEAKHTKAEVILIRDHKNLSYNAAFVLCDLYQLGVPDAVSLLKYYSSKAASNILPVRRKPTNHSYRTFTLCLSPLHTNFNDKLILVEWVEMNIILGVDKIFVYVQNCSNAVTDLLKIYRSKGIIDIMNWSLPRDLSNKRKKNLHNYGQLAAINDCIYRNKGFSLYIAAFDIDEYIVPQLDEDVTWLDMFARLPKANAYIFSNSFFIKNETGNLFTQSSITNVNFRRENFIYQPRSRSKFIAKTDEIFTTDIHFIREMNGHEHAVDADIGLLHHYRRRLPKHNEDKFDIESTVRNEATKKYSLILRNRMLWFLNNRTLFMSH